MIKDVNFKKNRQNYLAILFFDIIFAYPIEA